MLDWTPSGFGALIGLALAGAYVAIPAAVHLGNLLLSGLTGVVPPGNGGNGPPRWPPSSFEFFEIGPLFWAGFIIALFISMLVLSVKLLVALPLRPDWGQHARFSRRLRPSPIVVLVVLWTTNYLPTKWIEFVYSDRLFVSYLCSLAAVVYQAVFYFACPAKIREDPDLTEETANGRLRSRPVARYLLTLLAVSIALTMLWLSAMLVPNSFAHRPDNWWHVFLPRGSSGGD